MQTTQTAWRSPKGLGLIARYAGQAPRYTSYPTAVQFDATVQARTYREWLGQLDPHQPVSLYFHIPFCTRLCWYCGCNTRAVNRHDPIASYVESLLAEMAMLAQALPARMDVAAVHFGGGSPNLLSEGELDELFGAMRRLFRLTPNVEIAAELDPATLTEDWVRAAGGHGLTRASLGVQNLSPTVQKAVNRVESAYDIARAVAWLRADGVTSINLDLMYGLPHQTVENTLATVDRILPLRPERLAVFGYAHVPRMKAHQRLIDETALPGPAERLDQADAVAERLVNAGYVQIGLDHFALPEDDLSIAQAEGRLRRNFQGYTTDACPTLLGLGASSIGALPQGFVQNIAQDLDWRNAVAAGDLPIARGVRFTDDDRFRGDIIERLMCDMAVDLAAVCARHGRDLSELDEAVSHLDRFVEDGLLRVEGGQLDVTLEGRAFLRPICAAFDQYFAPEAGRHSRVL